jgi:polyhydroxyalkanoate synthesis regulator phasin
MPAARSGGSSARGGRASGSRTRKRTTSRSASTRAPSGARSAAGRGRPSSPTRADKSVEAFRGALERSVTLSRDRLQEVVDDAVKRGRMTRDDANELVSNLVSRGRRYRDDLLKDLERLLEQARREFGGRATGAATRARRGAGTAAGRAGRAARDAADQPLRRADTVRRAAGVGSSFPITAYDQLTATQVKSRLTDLRAADLRKIRTYEQRNKARKGLLDEIERRLTDRGGRATTRRRSTSRRATSARRSSGTRARKS